MDIRQGIKMNNWNFKDDILTFKQRVQYTLIAFIIILVIAFVSGCAKQDLGQHKTVCYNGYLYDVIEGSKYSIVKEDRNFVRCTEGAIILKGGFR